MQFKQQCDIQDLFAYIKHSTISGQIVQAKFSCMVCNYIGLLSFCVRQIE